MAYPNLKQSIWLLALFFIIQGVLAVPVGIVDSRQLENEHLWGILPFVSLLVILGYVTSRTDLDWKYLRQLFSTGFDWRVWACVVITVVGVLMFDVVLIDALTRIVPLPEWVHDTFSPEIGRETPLWSILVISVVIGPFVEELLVRGIILNGLLAHYTRASAIVWSAVLFGVYHIEPWQVALSFYTGLIWAWWVVRTGSLLPALFGHALINFVAATTGHLLNSSLPVSEDIDNASFLPWWLGVAGVALAALGLWWFSRVANSRSTRIPGARRCLKNNGTDAGQGLMDDTRH